MLQSIDDIEDLFAVIDRYELVSGSKVNLHKTVGLIINENMVGHTNGLRLTCGPENVLGVPLRKNKNSNSLCWNLMID